MQYVSRGLSDRLNFMVFTNNDFGRRVGVFTIFIVLATVLSRDEFRSPASIPLKSTDVATVPLFNVWTIGWNANRARHGFQGYWDAPIFHPAENAFAFSEPQPGTVLAAPVVWATGSAVAGYKFWMFLSLSLNGLFGAILLRRLGYGWGLQIAGGIAITLLPIAHQRIDVLQLLPVWGILWFWSSLFELDNRPTRRSMIETGLSFGACFALSVHHGVFLALLVLCAGVVFLPRFRDVRFLKATFGASLVGVLVVSPIVFPIYGAAKRHDFQRPDDHVERLSAKPVHYLASQSNALIKFERFQAPESRRLNPGWCRVALAAVGIGYGLFWGHRRRWGWFLLLTGTFAFGFSLGLNLDLGGWRPWETMRDNVPGFRQVRNVFRFAWFVQLAVILLAVEGLATLCECHQRLFESSRTRPTLRTTSFVAIILIPGALLAIEVWPEPSTRAGVPDVNRNLAWIEYVRDHAEPGRSVACLPFARGGSVRTYDMTTRWMCYGLEHGIPLVNGYSGFFPKPYLELRERVKAEFPSTGVLQHFLKLDVQFLVVARKYCQPNIMQSLASDQVRLDLVFADPVGIDVYRLESAHGTIK